MLSVSWWVGMLLAVTFMGDGHSEPVYPLKPVLAADEVPHIAATLDRHWIDQARRHFVEKQPSEGGSYPVLLILGGLILIIWIQCRRELRQEDEACQPPCRAAPEYSLRHRLASRWGLR